MASVVDPRYDLILLGVSAFLLWHDHDFLTHSVPYTVLVAAHVPTLYLEVFVSEFAASLSALFIVHVEADVLGLVEVGPRFSSIELERLLFVDDVVVGLELFLGVKGRHGEVFNAEAFADCLMTLPCHSGVNQKVIDKIRSLFKQFAKTHPDL